jgi:predicted DNA-binding antitoxin AbrB/MazE fold protein
MRIMFLKPVGKIQLHEGERIRETIEKKLSFEPIMLKKKLTSERIRTLKDDTWTFPGYLFYHPADH